MRRFFRWLLALVCVGFGSSGLVAVSTPIQVPGSYDTYIQDSAVDEAGNLVVVWGEIATNALSIRTALLTHDGTWSTPVILYSVDNMATLKTTPIPQIAVNPRGDAVVVWEEQLSSGAVSIKSALLSSGVWSFPMNVSLPNVDSVFTPTVTLNRSGYAVAAWQVVNGTNQSIQAATLLAGHGTWCSPVTISSTSSQDDSSLGALTLDDAGNAVAVWNYQNNDIRAAMLPYQGQWTPPVTISSGNGTNMLPTMVMNSAGYAVALWMKADNGLKIQSATLSFGKSWSQPIDVASSTGKDRESLKAAMDTQGNALAIWVEFAADSFGSDSYPYLQTSYLPFGKSWSTPGNPAPSKILGYFGDVAFDQTGNAIAAWYTSTLETAAFHTTMLPLGGSWSAPQNIKVVPNSGYFRLRMTPSGSAFISWLYDAHQGTVGIAEWKPIASTYELPAHNP